MVARARPWDFLDSTSWRRIARAELGQAGLDLGEGAAVARSRVEATRRFNKSILSTKFRTGKLLFYDFYHKLKN